MKFIDLIPALIQGLFSLFILHTSSKSRYSFKKTFITSAIFYVILMTLNVIFFYDKGLVALEKLSLFTIFIPEAIFVMIISKRKVLSSITASLSAYLAIYAVQMIKSVLYGTFQIYIFNYIYLFSFPVIGLFLRKIYVPLHDDLEKLQPRIIIWLLLFTLILYTEFFVYGMLIDAVTERVLRLEIFCVATTSIYYVAIGILYFVLREYKRVLIENNDYNMLQKTIASFDEIIKIREFKEEQLRVLRHDLKHVLISVNTLMNKKKYKEAKEFISGYVKDVETTSVTRYSTIPLLDAIIEYYKIICKEKGIKFNCKINNVEDALKVDIYEIVIFISNCLENAVNATSKLEENKYIKFTFLNNDGRLVLQIENSYNGQILYDVNNAPTNPEEGHGFGTYSNKWFAERNKLSLDYKITEDTFKINVLFKENTKRRRKKEIA